MHGVLVRGRLNDLLFFRLSILNIRCMCQTWQKSKWGDEEVWQSWHNEWIGIVSENRARLVYFGRGNPDANMLYSNPDRALAGNSMDPPSWGGHRFWLGPQSAWKPVWPPPEDWEFSAAAKMTVSGETLEVQMARANLDLPQIYRRYHWKDGGLVCEAAWENSGEPWCAVHVLAVPPAAQVRVALQRLPELPNGFGVFQIPSVSKVFSLPVAGLTIDGNAAHIRYGESTRKIGLLASCLTYQLHGATLTFSAENLDFSAEASLPDEGLVTQVYVGDGANPFIELEQLSGVPPIGSGRQSFSALLRPG